MAKKLYIGVSNVARKVAGAYIGVSNVARKITKGYIGVNGVAQLFYESKKPDEEVTLTISQTWKVPADAKNIDIFVVGGGGGAGGTYQTINSNSSHTYTSTDETRGASGGSGYTQTVLGASVTPGENLNIVIGAGGTGGKDYMLLEGVQFGDVTSPSQMTNGGDGGETYVARNGVKIASASGGKGGIKGAAGFSSGKWVAGANGGNGSGAGGSISDAWYRSSNYHTVDMYCQHGSTYTLHGEHGTEGGNGGVLDRVYIQNTSSGQESRTSNIGTGGTGQGHNTRKYGDASGTVYAKVATAISPNTGNSGDNEIDNSANKAGSSGVVIITVHY